MRAPLNQEIGVLPMESSKRNIQKRLLLETPKWKRNQNVVASHYRGGECVE